jgi:hypothetical protein
MERPATGAVDSTAPVDVSPHGRAHRERRSVVFDFAGEEILVLEGTFSDELGDYPAGTWMRSPHASPHQPFSRDGCLIYVKVGHLPPIRAVSS